VQCADFCRDAEQERQTGQNQRQRNILRQKQLYGEATASKQRAADNQAFEKAFMRCIQTGNIAAGGNERKQQTLLRWPRSDPRPQEGITPAFVAVHS
jgi:hypothetical protein